MKDHELSTLWIGACRYYLGRMTYAVSDFTEALYTHWEYIPESARSIIQKDINEAFNRDAQLRGDPSGGPLGMDCDKAKWEKVRQLWL